MKDFINKVLSNRENFLNESLTHRDTIKVQECVMKALKLDNLNQLRDKFEGLDFIERFSVKIFGVIALEKIIKMNLIDWDNIDPKNYVPRVNLFGKDIDIIMSNYGEFPVIEKQSKFPAILTVKNTHKSVWICGFADVDTLNKNQEDKFLKGEMTKGLESKTAFIGYNELKSFYTFDDLKALV